jgi:ABC-type transport system involved in cytochrome c biogenesis permease subunit
MPNYGQIALLLASIVFFTVGGVFSLARLWRNTNPMRLAGKSLLYWGILAAMGVLVWHSIGRKSWVPIGDNFDALIWLAVLLALFVAYIQKTRPLAALDWFVMPIVIAVLISAAVIGRTEYRSYVDRAWTYMHYATSFTGAAFFAVAAASGLMYVIAARRLRSKQSAAYLGSLERLEHLTMLAVTLGFALLTFGIITGAVLMIHSRLPTSAWKIALAGSVWVVYAIVLHAPINPVFRGRRAAVLSVLGFVLMIGTLVAVQFGQSGGGK